MTKKHMTAEEKGYKCPGLEDCTQCKFYKDLCIIYGKTGKKIAEKWRKKQLKTVKNQ
ncbi:hypothetical protein [Treponema sp.]|uniref:hypothetical protein n=1 Tax=Treponema sp. TaxID=166 RepID=UPI00388F8EEF